MISIIVPVSTRNLRWCTSFKGEISVFYSYIFHKDQTLSEISILTGFPLNITWKYYWNFFFRWLLIVIIASVSTRNLRCHMSLKCDISVFSTCFTWMTLALSLLTWFPINILRNYYWHFFFSWFVILIIVPGYTRNIRRCTLFKGEISMFYASFYHKDLMAF